MDCTNAELWVSIIALIVSFFSILFNYFINKKINNINLNSTLILEIVKDFIKEKLPNAREKIHFARKKLKGIDALQSVLNEFRRDILFLRYSDSRFFNKVKKYSQDLEDFIVSNEGKEFESFEQAKIQKKITREMIKIIKLVNKKYIG